MRYKYFRNLKAILLMVFALAFLTPMWAQQSMIVNLGAIDGIDITPDNIFNYQIQASATQNVQVTGTIRYRNNAGLYLSYTYGYTLRQGINTIDVAAVHPNWQFSSSALRELFLSYKKLPAGTYEYCVHVQLMGKGAAENAASFDECLYHKSDDLFLINLIDPDNNAKIHEFNPALSWVVNYPFASELTYRLRVAEIKQNQNPQNAITRNNPIYDENNIMGNSLVYPVYAKPLVVNQPYAWTVDAYFRGILLGSAETWKFTIVEDTLFTGASMDLSYIDIARVKGKQMLSAVGNIKIKYLCENTMTDTLQLQIFDSKQQEIRLKGDKLIAHYGDNRYRLNLRDSCILKDAKSYNLIIHSKSGGSYDLPFTYYNPDFIIDNKKHQ
ncbi:MAG: hypothetical protein JSS96_01990 [Bacteroidetes bacterium]|nr:hypothetical protein [Bacteroidota bacterium]